jgi:hypothetical protein
VYTIVPYRPPATLNDLHAALDDLHASARDTWRLEIQDQAQHFRTSRVPGYLQPYVSYVGQRHLEQQRRSASSAAEPGNDCLTGNADPLWVHDAIVFLADGNYDRHERDDAIATYLTDGGMSHTLHLEGQRLPLRLGLSACLFAGEQSSFEAAERMFETHGAIWAAAIDYDLRLNSVLSSPLVINAPLSRVEQELEELGRFQRAVSNFNASFSNAQAHLGWADQQLWKALYTSWALEAQLKALDGKLSAIKTSYSELATRVSTRRSRRLADFLILFTFLSAVSAAASITNFIRLNPSEENPSNTVLLLLYVAIAAALAGALWIYVHRKPH